MILVTGAAGFIGAHVSKRLCDAGEDVIGVDSLNDYYDVNLKRDRVRQLLEPSPRFRFEQIDLADAAACDALFVRHHPDRVIHLAAQPGVRYSLENPRAYTRNNIDAFLNVLESCRHGAVRHLVFASSSSVYGAHTHQPFSEHDAVDHPISLYAATKKANELMAHTYAHLFRVPCTGLRFFTVYGPWGRPDMAPFKFTRGIMAGEPIPVYNEGKLVRDFTYIDDIVESVVRILAVPAAPDPKWSADSPDPATSSAPYRIYNIGNRAPVPLLEWISVLEEAIGRKAKLDLMPMQPGDVVSTMADVSDLEHAVRFRPDTSVRDGVARFVAWYRSYYDV